MSKTYTETEVKEIYARLIDGIGADAGSICHWAGVDSVSLEDWKRGWHEALRSHEEYLQSIGAYNERKRIAKQLLELNNEKKSSDL